MGLGSALFDCGVLNVHSNEWSLRVVYMYVPIYMYVPVYIPVYMTGNK